MAENTNHTNSLDFSLRMNESKTCCAISTPPGIGGIAVIRVSGENAIKIVDSIFCLKPEGRKLVNQPANTISFGKIIDKNGETIDNVLVSLFLRPHSFTGEDTVEISCHGSVFIQQKILQLLINSGCTLASPGEFTQKAFLNGKLDLTQAEAIADLIASSSAASHRMAMNQMRGGISNELKLLRQQMLDFVSLIELELDFSEEDVQFADRTKLMNLSVSMKEKINNLIGSFQVGNALKNGIPVAIIGETNVGKSTLLNLLLKDDKAIVSDIHGTTRDVIEDTIVIDGITFRFIDTAGLRHTTDLVERMGIERTYQIIEQASIILWLLDSTQVSVHIEWLTERIAKRVKNKKLILVFNKIDKIAADEKEILAELFEQFDAERIYISAKKRLNTDVLQNALVKAAQLPEISSEDIIINNVRHYEALKKTHIAIDRVINGLETNLSGDFLSQDIREGMHHLGEITGQINNDEILGNIFSKFCIGK